MTTLKHKFISGKAAAGDPTLVDGVDWDGTHVFAGGAVDQVTTRDPAFDPPTGDGWKWAYPKIRETGGPTTLTPGAIPDGTYLTRSGTAVVGSDLDPLLTLFRRAAHGRCRLTKSGANLLLSPHDGNTLLINGALETIPDAGVTLAPTGLSLSTTYYIYAWMNTGTMALEASTTVPATQAGTGVKIKTGAATRTLVGLARTLPGGPAWDDTPARRFVLSYFNRRPIRAQNAFAAVRSTTSASFAELSSTERAEFLTWGDEAIPISIGGNCWGNTAGQGLDTAAGIDDAVAEDVHVADTSPNNGQWASAACSGAVGPLSEGYHYATVLGRITGGTSGSWGGSGTPGLRCAIHVAVQG